MPGITHKATAVDPEVPPPGAIAAPEWNDDHAIPADGVLIGDSTTDEIIGIAAASPGQYLRRSYSASGVTYAFESLPFLRASDFNFAPIAPVSNLVAGVATSVSISANIPGFAASSVGKHYVRIVDANPLLSENVLLQAGTTAGILFFTPANSHTAGQYTIQSASGGIQEAFHALPYNSPNLSGNGGTVVLDSTAAGFTIYAQVFHPGDRSVRLMGQGMWQGARIFRAAEYPAGNLFFVQPSNSDCQFTVQDVAIINQGGLYNTSGYAFRLISNVRTVIRNVWIDGGWGGFHVTDGAYNLFENAHFYQPAYYNFLADCGFKFDGVPNATTLSDCSGTSQFSGPSFASNLLNNGLLVNGCDGLQVNGGSFKGKYGIRIRAVAASNLANAYIVNVVTDESSIASLDISGLNAPFVYTGIRVLGGHFNSAGGNFSTSNVGINIEGDCDGVQIHDNDVSIAWAEGISVGGTVDWIGNPKRAVSIQGNNVLSNNLSNTPGLSGIIIQANSSGVSCKKNTVTNTPGIGNQKIGIRVLDGVTNSAVVDNNLVGNVDLPLQIGNLGANVLIDNNLGNDTGFGALASAATVNLPTNPRFRYYTVSGTTTIANISSAAGFTFYPGLRIIFRFTDASPGGVNATGNIYRAVSVVQNQSLEFIWDGTKWMVL